MSDKPEIIERVMDCESGTPISKDGWPRPSGTWVGENDHVRFGDVDLHVRNVTEYPDHIKELLQTLVGEGKGGHILGIDEVEELPTTTGDSAGDPFTSPTDALNILLGPDGDSIRRGCKRMLDGSPPDALNIRSQTDGQSIRWGCKRILYPLHPAAIRPHPFFIRFSPDGNGWAASVGDGPPDPQHISDARDLCCEKLGGSCIHRVPRRTLRVLSRLRRRGQHAPTPDIRRF